jgi:glyoxylase-like metal-dependent hydrolase (beta-lactamase superfamily II)
MAERCDTCLRNLRELLGNEATAGARIIEPDRLLERDEVLDLIGRRLHLIASEWSSAPGALAVYDEVTATLVAGDSVLIGRVPDLRDADVQRWQDLLARLKTTQCRLLVPGHGPIGRCAQIDTFAAYLSALDARIALLLKNGAALSDLAGRTDLPEFAQWDEYAAVHSRNAQRLYLTRERQAFDSKP